MFAADPTPRPTTAQNVGLPDVPGSSSIGGCCLVVLVAGVDFEGFGEVVFEDDDAAGGFDPGALVGDFTNPGGQAQLVAAVAAVSALGAGRLEQAGLLD